MVRLMIHNFNSKFSTSSLFSFLEKISWQGVPEKLNFGELRCNKLLLFLHQFLLQDSCLKTWLTLLFFSYIRRGDVIIHKNFRVTLKAYGKIAASGVQLEGQDGNATPALFVANLIRPLLVTTFCPYFPKPLRSPSLEMINLVPTVP